MGAVPTEWSRAEPVLVPVRTLIGKLAGVGLMRRSFEISGPSGATCPPMRTEDEP
jgi:hypothetical protein